MLELLNYLETITDNRQEKKVRHKLKDIIALVFFASVGNADDFVEMEVFEKEHEEFLLTVPGVIEWNSIARYDTACNGNGVAGILQGFQGR